MADPKFQLVQLFGTSDLLKIVGIKDVESYQNSVDDVIKLKIPYLRKVLRCHPNSVELDMGTHEGLKEVVARGKKLFVMNDIFQFLTSDDFELKMKRKDYFSKGAIPDLPSLQYLRDNNFKGDESDFKVPDFEDIAADLKSLYQQQLQRIRAMQESYQGADS